MEDSVLLLLLGTLLLGGVLGFLALYLPSSGRRREHPTKSKCTLLHRTIGFSRSLSLSLSSARARAKCMVRAFGHVDFCIDAPSCYL